MQDEEGDEGRDRGLQNGDRCDDFGEKGEDHTGAPVRVQ